MLHEAEQALRSGAQASAGVVNNRILSRTKGRRLAPDQISAATYASTADSASELTANPLWHSDAGSGRRRHPPNLLSMLGRSELAFKAQRTTVWRGPGGYARMAPGLAIRAVAFSRNSINANPAIQSEGA